MCITQKSVTYYNLVRSKSVSIVITDAKGSSAVFVEGTAKRVGKASDLRREKY